MREAFHAYKKRGHDFIRKRTIGRKHFLLLGLGVLLIGVTVFQFLYDTQRILPFAKIENVAVGGLLKGEAEKLLDDQYAEVKIPVYFKGDETVKVAPHFADLGIALSNKERVASYDYPWYIRLLPGSILWYGFIDQSGEVSVTRSEDAFKKYFTRYFGEKCSLAPVNAGVKVKDQKFVMTPAISGGECEYDEVYPRLKSVAVSLQPERVVVAGAAIYAKVSDADAEKEISRVNEVIKDGLSLRVGGVTETVPRKQVVEWTQYDVVDDALTPHLSAEKADAWLLESFGKKLEVAPGITTVSTRDFTETARVTGKNGQALDTDITRERLEQQMRGRQGAVSEVAVKAVAPTVQYQRSYSPTDEGLSALLKNFAEAHPGSYGISLTELSGKGRRAEYNAEAQFTTASTYKLFVVYSALLRVESGSMHMSDQVQGGRNLSQCIDDIIVKSDNPCADTLLRKIGFKEVTSDAKAMGAVNTSFMGNDGIKSTARDEAVFMGALYSGQILRQQAHRDVLISALKRNIYRRGVPAGVPGVVVANKVGFMDDLLHDASIVYSPSGAYVLVILTKGSSWENIAKLTREIEALRGQ